MHLTISGLLSDLGVKLSNFKGNDIEVITPIDGKPIAKLAAESTDAIEEKIDHSLAAFLAWRDVPAPQRGELVRLLGEELRKSKETLAELVTIECGKIIEEGRGEVQEMIDICDFAVGLSRTIGGATIPSERPQHVMEENWYPLGPVGIISSFNFPVAVWAWNAALALICGDSLLWKPSEKTPLTALACQSLLERAIKKYKGDVPEHLSQVIIGQAAAGEQLVNHPKVALVSATGSSRMGGIVAPQVAARFGKCLLELGGNNAAIVTPSADLNIALPSIMFGAVGTAGQRCTSTRRLFVHHSMIDEVFDKLRNAYEGVMEKIGSPLDKTTLVGPLIDEHSFHTMQHSLSEAKTQGGTVYFGERALEKRFKEAHYVQPALVRMPAQTDIVKQETFAPILYVMPYEKLEDVIVWHNAVPQGLSSAIFTTDLREATIFKQYSDCGITNVNIGTSGAEIGGAFGGEKETGGGRESGSDAWKNYMRRQTSTTYYGCTPPALAQGISFDVS